MMTTQITEDAGQFMQGTRALFGGRAGKVGGHFTVGAGQKRVMMNFDDGETMGVPLACLIPETKPVSVDGQLNSRQKEGLIGLRKFVVRENSFDKLNKSQREELLGYQSHSSGDDDVDAEYLALFNARFHSRREA